MQSWKNSRWWPKPRELADWAAMWTAFYLSEKWWQFALTYFVYVFVGTLIGHAWNDWRATRR